MWLFQKILNISKFFLLAASNMNSSLLIDNLKPFLNQMQTFVRQHFFYSNKSVTSHSVFLILTLIIIFTAFSLLLPIVNSDRLIFYTWKYVLRLRHLLIHYLWRCCNVKDETLDVNEPLFIMPLMRILCWAFMFIIRLMTILLKIRHRVARNGKIQSMIWK